MKKFTTTLLLCAILLSMAACGNEVKETTGTETNADTTAVADNTETESETELTRENTPDDLPEKDFGGKTFTIFMDSTFIGYTTYDELSGDAMEDAIYNRNSKVSDRFNVDFVCMDGGSYDDVSKAVNTAVLAGEGAYDVVMSHAIQNGINANKGCFMAWNNVPYVDFTKPWWNEVMVSDLNYKGYAFLAQGDMDLTGITYAGAIFYNKDLGAKFDIPDMFQIVREGKWTKEKLTELIAGTYVDVNGDGVRDEGDQYGFAMEIGEDTSAYLWCFGKRIYEKDADGGFRNVFYDEKLVNITEWIYDFKFNNECVYAEEGWNIGYKMMGLGNTVFTDNNLDQALWLRDSDVDFSILPMPKWDEAQSAYYSPVDGGMSCVGVTLTAADTELVGIMMEGLNAESWRTVTPAVVDMALKFKGARDAESIEMIDLIIDSRVVDFGVVYGGWNSARSAIKRVVDKAHSTDITSYYEENKPTWDATMDSVFAAFEELVAKEK